AAAPGTERGANGDFTLAGGGAREKKTGDVCAGNQKDQSDGADKHDERATHIADENVLQRFELHAEASVRFWKLGGDVSGNGVEFGLRLRNCDAGFEQSEGTEEMGAATLHGFIQEGSGKPQIGLRENRNVCREDADSQGGFAVGGNGFTDHLRITAEAVKPQVEAENYGFGD